MKNMLGSFTKQRHIIHAGYTFAGQGSWILQVGYYNSGGGGGGVKHKNTEAQRFIDILNIFCENVSIRPISHGFCDNVLWF